MYTFSPKISGVKKVTVFDTTVSKNWKWRGDEGINAIEGTETIAAANGRSSMKKGKAENVNEVVLETIGGEEKLKDVSFIGSTTAADTANVSVLKAANYGLALDRRYSTNFISTLTSNKVKLEEGNRGFSFYFSEKVNQIFFGEP